MNNEGTLTTMEGAPSLAAISEKNLEHLGLTLAKVVRGRFQDNLDKVIDENRPIDYVFIDGHHDEQATISYFEAFAPNLATNAVVVLDDISWSAGMRRAWNTIIANDKVSVSVDLSVIGICLLNADSDERHAF